VRDTLADQSYLYFLNVLQTPKLANDTILQLITEIKIDPGIVGKKSAVYEQVVCSTHISDAISPQQQSFLVNSYSGTESMFGLNSVLSDTMISPEVWKNVNSD